MRAFRILPAATYSNEETNGLVSFDADERNDTVCQANGRGRWMEVVDDGEWGMGNGQ